MPFIYKMLLFLGVWCCLAVVVGLIIGQIIKTGTRPPPRLQSGRRRRG